MKISNWWRALLMGVISAFATTLVCIVFTYVVHTLTNGVPVFPVSLYPDMQTVDSFYIPVVLIIGSVLSALVSLSLLRYTSVKFLFVYTPISIVLYVSSYFVIQSIDIINTPLNSWDYLLYYIMLFPLGAVVGTIISIITNQVRNYRK